MPRRSSIPDIIWEHTSREWAEILSSWDNEVDGAIWKVEEAVYALISYPFLKTQVSFADTRIPQSLSFSLAHSAQNFVREKLWLDYVGITYTHFFKTYSSKELSREDKNKFWASLHEASNSHFLKQVKPKTGAPYTTIKPSALEKVVEIFGKFQNQAIQEKKQLQKDKRIRLASSTAWKRALGHGGSEAFGLDTNFGGGGYVWIGGGTFRTQVDLAE